MHEGGTAKNKNKKNISGFLGEATKKTQLYVYIVLIWNKIPLVVIIRLNHFDKN